MINNLVRQNLNKCVAFTLGCGLSISIYFNYVDSSHGNFLLLLASSLFAILTPWICPSRFIFKNNYSILIIMFNVLLIAGLQYVFYFKRIGYNDFDPQISLIVYLYRYLLIGNKLTRKTLLADVLILLSGILLGIPALMMITKSASYLWR
jgi:hypothetical protein